MNFAYELPDPTTLRVMLQRVIELYARRDALINRLRMHLDGNNPVAMPASMTYKSKVTHGYHLNAILNEKASRYRATPQFKCLPVVRSDRPSEEARREAQELEKAVNVMMNTLSTGDSDSVWDSVVWDAISIGAGVEKFLAIPGQRWPRIIPYKEKKEDGSEEEEEKDDLYRSLEKRGAQGEYKKAKDTYLHDAGIPVQRSHVPLERFYPVFEGKVMPECFELEERSLRSVLSNPLFDTSKLSGYTLGQDKGMSQKVVILYYCNRKYYAYYALGPSMLTNSAYPTIVNPRSLHLGQPILLYKFEHNIGRPIYNYVPGRGGGWKDGTSAIEPVMNALLSLSQDQDELRSQILTYVRRVGWPTRLWKVSRESRGADEGLPPPPNVVEGGVIPVWADESIEGINEHFAEFSHLEWLYSSNEARMNALAGAPALFGERQPGVNTGYHQQLQLTAAESLDTKIEQHLSAGAVNGLQIVLEMCRDLGEKWYVQNVAQDKRGRPMAEYVCIDPKKLDALPMISAKVRDPRPQDLLTATQAATQLTTIRPGHDSPLVTDTWALEELLGIEDPDEMERQKWVEKKRREWLSSPIVSQEIGKALGLALAEQAAPGPINAEDAANASPGFQGAIKQINESGESAAMGGVTPNNLIAQAQGRVASKDGGAGLLKGLGGGVAPGNAQPAQTFGRSRQLLRDA